MSEVTGVVHRLQGGDSPGYGFAGIIMAWLAKLDPFAVVLDSVLFGGLFRPGGEIRPSGVPRMLQASPVLRDCQRRAAAVSGPGRKEVRGHA